jgi:HAD superfamily hydrolase (TIGR01509 family)
MRYKAIIFDVSDTLIEYSPNWARVFGDKIRSLGIDVSDEMTWEINKAVYWANGEQTRREQNGAPRATEDELSRLMDEAALSCVQYPSEMKDTYLQIMACMPMPKQKMTVIPGVFDMLDALQGKYRLAIVSNHYKWLVDYLKEINLYDYFESVIVSEVVGVEKPNVRIMELVLNELDLPPESCLYVGDHQLDVLCSKQAGMDCAWIARTEAKLHYSIPFSEDYKIDKVTKLLDIL